MLADWKSILETLLKEIGIWWPEDSINPAVLADKEERTVLIVFLLFIHFIQLSIRIIPTAKK